MDDTGGAGICKGSMEGIVRQEDKLIITAERCIMTVSEKCLEPTNIANRSGVFVCHNCIHSGAKRRIHGLRYRRNAALLAMGSKPPCIRRFARFISTHGGM